jgi:hypothetical protein
MKKRTAVSRKISKLRHEGVPERQAVAESLSMERAGKLTKGGGYRRSKKGRSKRSRSRYNRSRGGR